MIDIIESVLAVIGALFVCSVLFALLLILAQNHVARKNDERAQENDNTVRELDLYKRTRNDPRI